MLEHENEVTEITLGQTLCDLQTCLHLLLSFPMQLGQLYVIDRPGVAGAVLQTALSLTQ